MSNSNPVSLDLLNKFKHASSATISSTLAKKGYRFIYMAGIRPLKPGAKLVGRAITLRYLPSREDHVVSPDSRQSYAQQIALEKMGEGDVLVVDARGNLDAGIFGDLYVARIGFRKSAGVVTDGCFRDAPYLRTVDFPCFASSVHGHAHATQHWAVDVNLPVSCGNVLVNPGDVIVGDDDGVVVVPKEIAEEVCEISVTQESKEEFLRDLLEQGEPVQRFDVDPFTDELESRYQSWKKSKTG